MILLIAMCDQKSLETSPARIQDPSLNNQSGTPIIWKFFYEKKKENGTRLLELHANIIEINDDLIQKLQVGLDQDPTI